MAIYFRNNITGSGVLVADFESPVVPTFSVTSISPAGPYNTGDSITFNLSSASNAAGKTVTAAGASVAVTAQDINSASIDVFDPKSHGDLSINYSSSFSVTVEDAGETADTTLTITPDSGSYYGQISSLGTYFTTSSAQVGDWSYSEIVSGGAGLILDPETGSVGIPDSTTVLRHWYYNGAWVLDGDITIEGTSNVDATPDQFDLGADVLELEPSTLVERQFTVLGIDSGEVLTVTPTGDATASSPTAQLNDIITVSLVASGSFDTQVTGGVSLGGISDEFSVTTRSLISPTITQQPVSVSVEEGNVAAFSALFTDASTYQWYDASDDSVITGATSAALSIATVLADNGNTYYCIATSSEGGTAQTSTVTLTVTAFSDSVPPTIYRVGGSVLYHQQFTSYTDPGATAYDTTDGDITGSIVVGGDTVDSNTLGVYVITYDVADAAGNNATQVSRTVHVTVDGGYATLREFIDSLDGGSTTQKLLDWLDGKGFGGMGMTDGMYEYLKTVSSKNSNSERRQDWVDGGYN